MFLHYILHENEDSLLYKFLLAQMESPVIGDWWLTVQNDIDEFKLNLSLHEIKSMSKSSFKTRVKDCASKEGFKWLSEKKLEMKKVKNVHHNRLEIQKYLSSPLLSIDQTKLLFHFRSRMIYVRENYKNMHKDIFCPLCVSAGQQLLDSQEHLLMCVFLKTDSEISEKECSYEDIFSQNLTKQSRISILLEAKWTLRKELEINLSKS